MDRHRTLRTLAYVALLMLIGCSDPTAPLVLKGTKVVVENRLLSPVAIRLNGIDLGDVPAATSRTIQRGDLPLAHLEWRLIRPQENGRTLGDTMAGTFTENLPDDDNDSIRFTIDHIIGEGSDAEFFFAPLISNTTDVPMVIGVNMGLIDAEQRTDVIVTAGTLARYIGYYRLGSNSNVRAYAPPVAYSPIFYIEQSFGIDFDLTDLEAGSGGADLLFDVRPPRNERRKNDGTTSTFQPSEGTNISR